jgi:hypothetical protein
VQKAEKMLGYKLPKSYIALLKSQNGGTPRKTCFPTKEATSWAEDHIEITSIRGLGGRWGIDSPQFGSKEAIKGWGYPDIGIVLCDGPSGGHDAVMLDYRKCGSDGEPEVVHVDVEIGVITFLAKDFESFIKGLVGAEKYDTSPKEEMKQDMLKVNNGKFSALLERMCRKATDYPKARDAIRKIAKEIVEKKERFLLHADGLSYLMYDIQFLLFENLCGVSSRKQYLQAYPGIIAFADGFGTGGYGPCFVEKWFDKRFLEGAIEVRPCGLRRKKQQIAFTKEYVEKLRKKLAKYLK